MCYLKPKKIKQGRRKFQKRLSKSRGHNESLHGSTTSTCVRDLAYGEFGVRISYSKSCASLPPAYNKSCTRKGNGRLKLQPTDLPYLEHMPSDSMCDNLPLEKKAISTGAIYSHGVARISAAEIQSLHREISRYVHPYGRVWRRIFADVGVSIKPAEVKMGKSKGGVSYWCSKFASGKIAFELDGISKEIAKEAIRSAHKKSRFSLHLVCAT